VAGRRSTKEKQKKEHSRSGLPVQLSGSAGKQEEVSASGIAPRNGEGPVRFTLEERRELTLRRRGVVTEVLYLLLAGGKP